MKHELSSIGRNHFLLFPTDLTCLDISYEWNHRTFVFFLVWLISLNLMTIRFVHIVALSELLTLKGRIRFHCVYTTVCLWNRLPWTLRLLLFVCQCESCCCEYDWRSIHCFSPLSQSFWVHSMNWIRTMYLFHVFVLESFLYCLAEWQHHCMYFFVWWNTVQASEYTLCCIFSLPPTDTWMSSTFELLWMSLWIFVYQFLFELLTNTLLSIKEATRTYCTV